MVGRGRLFLYCTRCYVGVWSFGECCPIRKVGRERIEGFDEPVVLRARALWSRPGTVLAGTAPFYALDKWHLFPGHSFPYLSGVEIYLTLVTCEHGPP